MDRHITFTQTACGFCAQDIRIEDACPNPTCGLVVHLHALIGGPGYPVMISPECGQDHAGELVIELVKTAAHTVADRQLDARLDARTAAEVEADEAARIEHGVSEEDYAIKIFSGGGILTSEEVAAEVVKLLTELKIDHFIDQEIRALAS